jgi:hypothetical protein
VRGHPVRYWFKPSGVPNEGSPAASMPRRAVCARGSLGGSHQVGADRTAAAAAIARSITELAFEPTPKPDPRNQQRRGYAYQVTFTPWANRPGDALKSRAVLTDESI